MMSNLFARQGVLRSAVLVAGVLMLGGCNAGVQPASPAGQAEVMKPPVPLAISINALMVAQVDHASHELWDAGRDGHAPNSDQAWEEIEHHAQQLAAAATLISLGGTGQADAGWVVKPDWKPQAQKLSDTAMRAVQAAHDKNLQALLKAGDDLTDVCESCHKEFKPTLPSEGVVHPHYRR
jgi:cytochrome c556